MMLKRPTEAAHGAESRTGPLWTWGWIVFWGIIAFVALMDVTPAKAQFVANEFGYADQNLTRDTPTLADGPSRSVDILLYGP